MIGNDQHFVPEPSSGLPSEKAEAWLRDPSKVECDSSLQAVCDWLQAHRDNERIAFQDDAFAKHLWQMSGLADVFKHMDLDDGQAAVGLNPNIRLYKYATHSGILMYFTAICYVLFACLMRSSAMLRKL